MSNPPPDTDAQMRVAISAALATLPPGVAVVLLVAPFNAPVGARVNYIANANRADIVLMMKEVVGRFEGRTHDAPGKKQ